MRSHRFSSRVDGAHLFVENGWSDGNHIRVLDIMIILRLYAERREKKLERLGKSPDKEIWTLVISIVRCRCPYGVRNFCKFSGRRGTVTDIYFMHNFTANIITVHIYLVSSKND